MSAAEANPPVSQESKTAMKKKAKAKAAAKDITAQPSIEAEGTKPNADNATNGTDGAYESPYMKELYKYVRGIGCCFRALEMTDGGVGAFAMSRRSW